MFGLFKRKEKKKMFELKNENGMYKLYDGDKLLMWGTDVTDILIYMQSNEPKGE